MKRFDFEHMFANRRTVLAGLGGLAWTGLIARLFQLQVLDGKKFEDLAAENGIKLDLAPPSRGVIYDRFGRPLASHRRAGRISLIREQVPDLAATLDEIARHIDLSPERRARIIRDARRKAAFVPTVIANELTYEDFALMNVRAAEWPGVQVEMAETRSYPRGRDFAHILGYVAKASEDDVKRITADMTASEAEALRLLFLHPNMRTGRQGMERFAEDWLRGSPGRHALVINADGRVIGERPESDIAAQPGKDIYLTIDADLQRAVIERFGEESGAAVIIDVASGDILAMVSTPAFDPNDFVNGISTSAYNLLREDDDSPLYPRAHGGVYPPGSTYKMVVASAALEAGINPSERVYCPGHYRFGNRTWHCWKRGGHGSVNMHQAIKGSCDTYFYDIARRTGVERIADMSRRYGFGQKWELGLTGGRAGLVPDEAWKLKARGEKWYEGETLNFGIGQGQLGTTPLQLAVMAARIAVGGEIVTPRIMGYGPDVHADIPFDAPIDPEIIERMQAGMYGVTSEAGGTAGRSGLLWPGGPRQAGKTGTAQVRRISAAERASGIRKGGAIARKLRDHALFVSYAPADDPKLACAVIVEHGEGGSRTAAPVARDILAYALQNNSLDRPKYRETASLNTGNKGMQ